MKLFDQCENLINRIADASESRHHLFLCLILLLGFLLRLHGLLVGEGFREFSIKDELVAYNFALSFLAGEPHTWYLGQPEFSGGLIPGPLWTLFWVCIYKLGGSSPEGAMFWMLCLNTLVVYLVYRFATMVFERNLALFCALLYATGAWPMFYSLSLWNPIPMAFWGVVLFMSLWGTTQKEKSKSIFFVCLISAVLPQFHMIGLFYVPAVLLILYLSPVSLNKKWFVLGFITAVGLYIPYLVGEISNNWQNTTAILSKSSQDSVGVMKVITTPMAVLSNQISRWTGYGFESYRNFGDKYFGSFLVLLIFNLFSIVLSVTFVSLLFKRTFEAMKGRWLKPSQVYSERTLEMFISIILMLPPLLFLLTRHNYGSRYSILIFPLLFLLPALYFKTGTNRELKKYLKILISLTVLFNCYLYMTFNYYIEERIETAGYFTPSFRKLEYTRQQIVSRMGGQVSLQIIPDAYSKSPSSTEEQYTGGQALSYYFEIFNKYLNKTSGPLRKLYLVPQSGLKPGQEPVYVSNGMAVVRNL